MSMKHLRPMAKPPRIAWMNLKSSLNILHYLFAHGKMEDAVSRLVQVLVDTSISDDAINEGTAHILASLLSAPQGAMLCRQVVPVIVETYVGANLLLKIVLGPITGIVELLTDERIPESTPKF